MYHMYIWYNVSKQYIGDYMLFKYGKVATGKFFYDRTKMQKDIKALITLEQSFMIKAPRRFGKTSLIKHVMATQKKDYLYIDFRKTPRVEIVNEKIAEFLYSKMGLKGALAELKESAISFLLNNKTTITIKATIFEASVELFSNQKIAHEEKMMKYLDMLNELGQELNEVFFVVLDEFQDVKKISSSELDILEMLRGTLQHHDNVCYIFAGSNMTIMTEIFENSKSGFFNSCRKLKLKPFDIDELLSELLEAFKTKKIVFDRDKDLRDVLERLNGHPANTMMVMQNIEIISMDKELPSITKEDIDDAYERALDEMSDLISEYLKEIKSKDHLHDVIYRTAREEVQDLNANSLRQKRDLLVKMGYIAKVDRGSYEIVDGFLKDELLGE